MCLGTQGPRSWRSVENLKTGPESSLANAPFQSPFASPTERLPHSTQSELPRLRVPGPDTSVSPRSSRHSKQQSLEHCALAATWHGDPCPEKLRGHVRAADDGKRKTKNSTIPKVETMKTQSLRPISREPGHLPILPRQSRQVIFLSSARRQSTRRPATTTNGFPTPPQIRDHDLDCSPTHLTFNIAKVQQQP